MPSAVPVFDRAALDGLAAAYPLTPVVVRHALCGHPLLAAATLRRAAVRMNAAHVEARFAAAAIGGPFGERHHDPGADGWIMLRFIHQLPEYHAILASVLAELDPVIRPKTGAAQDMRGFAFVSAPETVTPFHFDPEYNLLFQIAGTKRFAVHSAALPCLPEKSDRMVHIDGNNILAWDESASAHTKIFTLTPGDVLFVPYKAPHYVVVDDQPSVSLSLTWQSDWTYAQRCAHRFNARLSRWGLVAPPLPQWPRTPLVRALAGRVLDRLVPL